MKTTGNPYEERLLTEEELQWQLDFITCPHCQTKENILIEDYHTGAPPSQSTLRITWICEACSGDFTTTHHIDDEGCLKRNQPIVDPDWNINHRPNCASTNFRMKTAGFGMAWHCLNCDNTFYAREGF